MTLDGWLVVLAGLGAVVVLGSRIMEHVPLTGPLLALLVGAGLGPAALDLLSLTNDHALVNSVSEVVMAVALMAVALRYPFGDVAPLRRPLAWLLTAGMIGMAGVVALLAWLLLDLDWRSAWLLGAVLAATDPVLSFSIVTGEAAEEVIPSRLRRLLSMEAGANDGLALPLVMLGLVLIGVHGVGTFAFEGIVGVVIAVVVGVALGVVAGRVLRHLDARRDIEDSSFFVFTLVLALFTLGVVNLLRGDGVLAVFVAGLAYNRVVGPGIYEAEREVEEGVNRALVLPVFMLLGVVLPWSEWSALGPAVLIFAAAVLLLRRLPVIALLRRPLGLDPPDVVFYGWFGPIGVAALFWVTHAIEEGARDAVLWPAAALVVASSTVVHGVTGTPGRALYDRVARREADQTTTA